MPQRLNTFFDQVYVINLKARTDRRAEMDAQLQRIGLGLNAPKVTLFEAVRPVDAAGFPSVGARGCFMSHLQVLCDARAKGLGSVLILEDDLNFCDHFGARFAQVADFLSSNGWGMFYGSYFLPPVQSQPALRTEPQAQQPSSLPCTRAAPSLAVGTSAMVAVHGQHLDLLIGYLEAMLARPPGDPAGGPMHLDGAYCWFRQAHPDVVTWLASPPLGVQRASRTDIHALRWFDRNPVSAGVVALLRRWRNWRSR